MIEHKLAKLRFTAEELALARYLAMHAPDAFDARTIARHILIRARDFIGHSRELRKPLIQAGIDTRAFHRAKEAYATYFNEYYKVSRDRISAHLQDIDFRERLELWSDIEIGKINFFVDGAREIYESLATQSIPGYVPYANPIELDDENARNALMAFQRSKRDATSVELGVDPLAMARDNTTASLNFTPIHSRAGQLTLIRRWISIQTALLERLRTYPSLARIIKVRIITDIVSFCDCLVTRSVSSGAPQEMDGLDKLVIAEGLSAAPIADFVAVSHFDTELRMARQIRDRIGAHLETDDAYPLKTLIDDVDEYDFEAGLAFYKRALAAFIKLCFSIIFMRIYVADGSPLPGVLTGSLRAVPFAGETQQAVQRPPPPAVNDEEAYRHNLNRWLDGDETQRGEARHFFYSAFQASETIEQIEETEHFGSGSRFSTIPYRKAHAFLASCLVMDHLGDGDFAGILELVLSCRSGHPYPLAELLVRRADQLNEFRQSLICYVLGEIASSPHDSANAFLEARAKSGLWSMRLPATLALFKTFVKSEGSRRANDHGGKSTADYAALVHNLTRSMSEPELLISLLAFASILSGRGLSVYRRWFEVDYKALQEQVEMACLPYLRDDVAGNKAKQLKQLIGSDDYVGVALMVAVELENDPRKLLRDGLLDSCCRGHIAAAASEQANYHLAMCLYSKKDYGRALEITRAIASRNPDLVRMQTLIVQILAEVPGAEEETMQAVARIRRTYKLDANNEAVLAHVEQEMAQRKPR